MVSDEEKIGEKLMASAPEFMRYLAKETGPVIAIVDETGESVGTKNAKDLVRKVKNLFEKELFLLGRVLPEKDNFISSCKLVLEHFCKRCETSKQEVAADKSLSARLDGCLKQIRNGQKHLNKLEKKINEENNWCKKQFARVDMLKELSNHNAVTSVDSTKNLIDKLSKICVEITDSKRIVTEAENIAEAKSKSRTAHSRIKLGCKRIKRDAGEQKEDLDRKYRLVKDLIIWVRGFSEDPLRYDVFKDGMEQKIKIEKDIEELIEKSGVKDDSQKEEKAERADPKKTDKEFLELKSLVEGLSSQYDVINPKFNAVMEQDFPPDEKLNAFIGSLILFKKEISVLDQNCGNVSGKVVKSLVCGQINADQADSFQVRVARIKKSTARLVAEISRKINEVDTRIKELAKSAKEEAANKMAIKAEEEAEKRAAELSEQKKKWLNDCEVLNKRLDELERAASSDAKLPGDWDERMRKARAFFDVLVSRSRKVEGLFEEIGDELAAVNKRIAHINSLKKQKIEKELAKQEDERKRIMSMVSDYLKADYQKKDMLLSILQKHFDPLDRKTKKKVLAKSETKKNLLFSGVEGKEILSDFTTEGVKKQVTLSDDPGIADNIAMAYLEGKNHAWNADTVSSLIMPEHPEYSGGKIGSGKEYIPTITTSASRIGRFVVVDRPSPSGTTVYFTKDHYFSFLPMDGDSHEVVKTHVICDNDFKYWGGLLEIKKADLIRTRDGKREEAEKAAKEAEKAKSEEENEEMVKKAAEAKEAASVAAPPQDTEKAKPEEKTEKSKETRRGKPAPRGGRKKRGGHP